ncbi:phosphoribosyltransferase [Paenibacillus sp. N3.4]|nr:phosphoribosyltransferase [Paenibacillus sp. N3.4]
MAARINKKRSFLFVSKVLGKHIPVNPYTSLLSGASLALLLQQSLEGNMPQHLIELAIQGIIDPAQAETAYKEIMSHHLSLPQSAAFIGFAETATAIGHAAFQTFGANSSYIHTTREIIDESESIIHFSEEHSHATAHYCYAADPRILTYPEMVVLVDDELTTGKTSLNIIRDIQMKFPKRRYYILALLDWRTQEDHQQFLHMERELGIEIHVLSLVKGEVAVSGSSEDLIRSTPSISAKKQTGSIRFMYVDQWFKHVDEGNQRPFLRHSGRFGLVPEDREEFGKAISQAAAHVKQTRIGNKTLCVGTGEFMYIPMRIAAEMGEGVSYQSTTRSPIHTLETENYAVQVGYPYPSPEDPEVTHFLYNIPPGLYDDIYLFFEREADFQALHALLEILHTLNLQHINFVFFSPQTYTWKETEQWQIGELSQ